MKFVKILTILLTFSFVNSENVNASAPAIDFSSVVEKVVPAIVNISTTQKIDKKKPGQHNLQENPYDLFREFLEKELGLPEQLKKAASLGSGFIIAADGYVVTNYHVIEGADEITVTMGDDKDKHFIAKLVGQDPKTDLALLKIDTKDLPYLEFGDSDKAKVGSPVMAIGNPFGLGSTVTSGIISAKSRYIGANSLDDFIQTDAAINRGNSGGPLCDVDGKVLGVNSVIVSPSGGSVGIGFAIPVSTVKPVIDTLKEKGSIERGWIGVRIQAIDENIAKGMGLKDKKGALITAVVNNSPASTAGLKVGDVILKLDGKEIDSVAKLPKIVSDMPINKSAILEIFRDSSTKTINVIIKKPESDDPFGEEVIADEKNSKTAAGVTVTNLNDENRRLYSIDSTAKGVVISDIDRESIIAFTGIKVGDLIVSINQKPITDVMIFEKTMKDLKKGSAAIMISRKGMNMFVGIELK